MNAIKRWFVKWSAEEQFRNVNARMPEVIRACNALDAALRRGESGELEKQAVMTQFQHLVKASRGPATPAQVAAAFIIPTRNLLPEPHAGRVCLAEYLNRTTVEADDVLTDQEVEHVLKRLLQPGDGAWATVVRILIAGAAFGAVWWALTIFG